MNGVFSAIFVLMIIALVGASLVIDMLRFAPEPTEINAATPGTNVPQTLPTLPGTTKSGFVGPSGPPSIKGPSSPPPATHRNSDDYNFFPEGFKGPTAPPSVEGPTSPPPGN